MEWAEGSRVCALFAFAEADGGLERFGMSQKGYNID